MERDTRRIGGKSFKIQSQDEKGTVVKLLQQIIEIIKTGKKKKTTFKAEKRKQSCAKYF